MPLREEQAFRRQRQEHWRRVRENVRVYLVEKRIRNRDLMIGANLQAHAGTGRMHPHWPGRFGNNYALAALPLPVRRPEARPTLGAQVSTMATSPLPTWGSPARSEQRG